METDQPKLLDGGSPTDHGANLEQPSSSTRSGEATSERWSRPGEDPSTEAEPPRADKDTSVDIVSGILTSVDEQNVQANLPNAEEVLMDPTDTHDNESDRRDGSTRLEALLSSPTPEHGSASLWAAAYSSLHEEDSKLVDDFELTVSGWLAAKGYKDLSNLRDHGSNSTRIYKRFLKGPLYIVFTDFLDGFRAPQRMMSESPPTIKRSVEEAPSSLAETSSLQDGRILGDAYNEEKSSEPSDHGRKPSEPDQPSPSQTRDRQVSTPPGIDEPGSGPDDAQALKHIFRSALQSCPHACLTWTVSYILLESLAARRPRTSKARSYHLAITEIIGKVQSYSQLFKLLWWTDEAKQQKLTEGHRVKALTDLYKSVLSFLLRAATHCIPESPSYHPDFEESTLSPFPDERHFFKIFDGSPLTHRLEVALDLEMGQEPDISEDSDIDRAIAKLHIDRLPATLPDSSQSHMLRSVWDWASDSSQFKAFFDWTDNLRCRVLWVEGIPGTGKSMLLRTAVDFLATADSAHAETKRQVISFFCDDTKWRQGTVLSAVKTLISGLLVNQPELLKHLYPVLHEAVDLRAEDSAPLLCKVLLRMVQDKQFCSTYVILDGLEQFTLDIDQRVQARNIGGNQAIHHDGHAVQVLKGLIAATIKLSDRIKWLVSSEPRYCNTALNLGSGLANDGLEQRLSLSVGMSELVQRNATQRITSLIDEPDVNGPITSRASQLLEDVPTNFLWINLALDMLRTCSTPWSLPDVLHDFVEQFGTVDKLYQRNFGLVSLQHPTDQSYCEKLLYTAAAAYRPLLISELVAIIKLPEEVQISILISKLLPAFLEISEDRVYFKHLSSRIFVQNEMKKDLNIICIRHHIPTKHCKDCNIAFKHHRILAEHSLKTILSSVGCTHSEVNSEACTAEPGTGSEYSWSIWPRHLSELYSNVAEAAAVIHLAEHLSTIHLIRWLQHLANKELLHEAVSEMFCLANEARSALFTDTHALMSVYYDEWLSQVNSMTGNPTQAAEERVKRELLFSDEYPVLGGILRPLLFPHLKSLFQTGSSASPLRQLVHSDWVRGCCFSPDGELVVSVSDEAYIRLWDTRSWKLQDIMGKYDEYALGAVMSPVPESAPGNFWLAAFDRKHIRVWNVGTGALVKTLSYADVNSKGDSSDFSDCDIESIALAPQGDLLAAVMGGKLVLWSLPEASDGRVLDKGVNSPLRRIVFAPSKRLLAASFSDKIRVWDLEDGAGRLVCSLPKEAKVDPPENEPVGETTFPEDPAKTEDTGNVLNTGEATTELVELSSDLGPNGTGHSAYIDGLAFSPNSKLLVSGSDDTTARIWDLGEGRSICTLSFDSSQINSVGFSHDGRRLVTGSQNGSMAIWAPSLPDGWEALKAREYPEQVFFEHDRGVSMLSFSPHKQNGDLIASSSYDSRLQICRLNKIDNDSDAGGPESSGTQVKGHREPVVSVAVSDSGNLIAAASRSGHILLWTMVSERGQCSIVPRSNGTEFHHNAYVSMMRFSPDEKMLATGGSDGRAIVWVISANGMTPTLLLEHSDYVQAIQFNPNGQMLATGEDDGTVRLFSLPDGLADGNSEPLNQHPPKQDSVAPDVEPDERREPPQPSDSPTGSRPFPWKPTRTFKGHTDFVRGVAFSPDSKTLASCGHDEHVLIWSIEEEEVEKALLHDMYDSNQGFGRLYSVVFVKDNTKVLSCSHGGKIALWDLEAKEGAWCRVLQQDDVDAYRSMRIDPGLPNFFFTEVGAVRYSLDDGEGADERSSEDYDRPPGWPLLRTDWQTSEIFWGKGENEEKITVPPWLRLRGPALCYYVPRNKVIVGCLTGQILVFEFNDDTRLSLNERGAEREGLEAHGHCQGPDQQMEVPSEVAGIDKEDAEHVEEV
ncbi:unnamed protein product [Clonostachys rhizophaga]|uniref:Nephrocystin 3-like N-terminal domain-containing protein n=1 Tax=Clonostachys rhizophaga TaxID=160324 RepID=A0A9N9VMJ5_9HYPO|nr:unnamed protein product [Clonostachys rhizophaga]